MGQGYFHQDENSKKWSVQFYYTDYSGKKARKRKTGFATKREAKQFMDEFIRKKQSDIGMTFESFLDEYKSDVYLDIRESTIATKTHMIDLHILPYFKDRSMSEISALDIKKWQNEIKKKGFSNTYLRSIHSQLSAIFNHAVRYYNLASNPCKIAGSMGKDESGNMGIWSQDEMEQFLDAVKDKTEIYYAFFLMYWTGLRVGELLALNVGDIDFNNKILQVNKSLNRVKREDIITPPKTRGSIRKIPLPNFVLEQMQDYIGMLYGRTSKDRLFTITKSHLEKEIKRGARLAGLDEIRVHDLRHSHASLLISQNVDIATVSKRLGHEKLSTTLNVYGHMYNDKEREVADMLDNLYEED